MLSAAIPGHHTESPEFTRCFADFHCPGRKMFEKTNSPPTKLKRRRGIFIGWDLEKFSWWWIVYVTKDHFRKLSHSSISPPLRDHQ